MVESRHLENAPIVEAIIDLRVKLPPAFHIDEFLSLKDTLYDEYPKHEERRLFFEFGFQEGKPIARETEEIVDGIRFTSKDSKQVVQFRKDGFTFSLLQPYTEWKDILEKAKSLWELYILKSSPEVVTRIAARYINHIELPLPVDDLASYLVVTPRIPDSFPQNLVSFFNRVVVLDSDKNVKANIIQALEKNVSKEAITVILDIDVYKQVQYKVGIDDIWSDFQQLHDLKNTLFFGSITQKTVRLFE